MFVKNYIAALITFYFLSRSCIMRYLILQINKKKVLK
jgi:hypothetical protein